MFDAAYSPAPPGTSKPPFPIRLLFVIVVVAAAVSCVCGLCLFAVGAPFGDSLGLATVCVTRSVDQSNEAAQKCANWAVKVVLDHADAYNQCEAARANASPGEADDAIILCLEDQGLGPND